MMRRNRTHDTVHRRRRLTEKAVLMGGGVFALILSVAFFFGDMGLLKYVQMRDNARQLEQEIRGMERANEELRMEIRRTQSDPARLEELARERLGFVRPGETVYQIVREPDRGTAKQP
jgi:cell division protein FtsB